MQSISTRKAPAVFIACALSSFALGEAFTNHAGHVASGRLSAISNGVAVISGRRYPLAVFPECEQRRMRELLEVPDALPSSLDALRRSLRERVLRAEALAAAGATDGSAVAAQRAKLQAAWARALKADKTLSPATRAHWRPRLMDP